jgi:hypothetical protein
LVMVMGLLVGRLFRTCAVIVQKWAELPLSAMAKASSGGMTVGGGPTRDTVLGRHESESRMVTLS